LRDEETQELIRYSYEMVMMKAKPKKKAGKAEVKSKSIKRQITGRRKS